MYIILAALRTFLSLVFHYNGLQFNKWHQNHRCRPWDWHLCFFFLYILSYLCFGNRTTCFRYRHLSRLLHKMVQSAKAFHTSGNNPFILINDMLLFSLHSLSVLETERHASDTNLYQDSCIRWYSQPTHSTQVIIIPLF